MATRDHATTRSGREIGQRQSLFREVNERIEEVSDHFDLGDRIPIVCECANDGCHEQIELTQAEYERLRRVPTHFAVLPGHDIPAAERIVERNSRYVTVEKFGESGIAAVKLDPRRRRPA
jgi:hypothetical protein